MTSRKRQKIGTDITPSPENKFQTIQIPGVFQRTTSFLPETDKLQVRSSNKALSATFQKQINVDLERFESAINKLQNAYLAENMEEKKIRMLQDKVIEAIIRIEDPRAQVYAFVEAIGETPDYWNYLLLPDNVREIVDEEFAQAIPNLTNRYVHISDFKRFTSLILERASPQLLRKIARYNIFGFDEISATNPKIRSRYTNEVLKTRLNVDDLSKSETIAWLQDHNIWGQYPWQDVGLRETDMDTEDD